MRWNYRVLAHKANDSYVFAIHEVQYDENDKKHSYNEKPIWILGESINELKETLKRIEDCFDKPTLFAGDKFPEEFKEK